MLTTIRCEIQLANRERESINSEIASIGAARGAEAESRAHGLDHHRADALYRQLLERRVEIDSQIEKLQEKQIAQMNRYLATRQEREVISDLEEKRIRSWTAKAASREMKQIEELFLARFGRS